MRKTVNVTGEWFSTVCTCVIDHSQLPCAVYDHQIANIIGPVCSKQTSYAPKRHIGFDVRPSVRPWVTVKNG